MANINIDKQNKQEQQSSQQNPQTGTAASTAMQPSGQSGQGWPGSSLARRNAWTPALFSLNPREFFSASPFELMRRFSEEMDRAFESFGLTRGDWSFGNQSAHWSPAKRIWLNLVTRKCWPQFCLINAPATRWMSSRRRWQARLQKLKREN